VKVDKGLADEANGVQLMKEMPNLDALLRGQGQRRIRHQDALGHQPSRRQGIEHVVAQQFTIANRSLRRASCPSSSPR
jgi:fructose-bisphosphate aldolase class I